MEIRIFRNDKVVKHFRKFFDCFITREMKEWAFEKFPKAEKIVVDTGSHQIRVYYYY